MSADAGAIELRGAAQDRQIDQRGADRAEDAQDQKLRCGYAEIKQRHRPQQRQAQSRRDVALQIIPELSQHSDFAQWLTEVRSPTVRGPCDRRCSA